MQFLHFTRIFGWEIMFGNRLKPLSVEGEFSPTFSFFQKRVFSQRMLHSNSLSTLQNKLCTSRCIFLSPCAQKLVKRGAGDISRYPMYTCENEKKRAVFQCTYILRAFIKLFDDETTRYLIYIAVLWNFHPIMFFKRSIKLFVFRENSWKRNKYMNKFCALPIITYY